MHRWVKRNFFSIAQDNYPFQKAVLFYACEFKLTLKAWINKIQNWPHGEKLLVRLKFCMLIANFLWGK